MENYTYYINEYNDDIPLRGYGVQFKQYLDDALSGGTIDISKISEELKNVDEHITNVIINVEGNLSSVMTNVENNLATVMGNIEKNISCQLSKSTCSINTNIKNAVSAINCHSDKNKEEIITSVIANKEDSVVRITASVKTEVDNAKERLEQMRQELVNAINNTGEIVELGFTNLNEQIINSKNEIISEINK